MTDGSTVKISPGFRSVFGFFTWTVRQLGVLIDRALEERLTILPLSLTWPWTTKPLACHTLVAKHALKTSTSILRSTSLKIMVPTGARAAPSFRFSSRSVSVRPPARSRPSTNWLIPDGRYPRPVDDVPEPEDDDEDAAALMLGSVEGRYHRSKLVWPIWSP